jgi:hypothetical protein
VQSGSISKTLNSGAGFSGQEITGLTGFSSAPKILIQKRYDPGSAAYAFTGLDWKIDSVTTSSFKFSAWNDSTMTLSTNFDWVAIGW